MTDIHAINRECRVIALMISRGDHVVAQKKINTLISQHPTLSGNIRLTITSHLLDIIDNGQEASDGDTVRTPLDGDVHDP